MKGLQFLGNRVEDAANAFIDVLLSEEEVVNAIDNDLSVYAECSCGNSFYIETEDEQDNYSEW